MGKFCATATFVQFALFVVTSDSESSIPVRQWFAFASALPKEHII